MFVIVSIGGHFYDCHHFNTNGFTTLMVKKRQKRIPRPQTTEGTKLPPGVTLLRTLEGSVAQVYCAAFDPQGAILATGGEGPSVQLWEASSGRLLRTLKGHRGRIWTVAVNPQGGTL